MNEDIISITSLKEIALFEALSLSPVEALSHSAPETLSLSARLDKDWLSLLFVLKGSGTCLRGGEVLRLEERTVYTGVSGCFRQFKLVDGTTGYLVTINPNQLGAILENVTVAYKGLFSSSRSCVRLDAETAEEMNWLITKIIKRTKEKHRFEIIQKYVSLILLYLKAEIKDELLLVSMNRNGVLIKDFFALLEDGFMTARTVDYYADKLCVSPKYLTSVIKSESGYPTSYHIHKRIVFEAKRIVQASGASLKEIAYELGYEDVAAFSKLFKRVSGETFSSYKCSLKFGVISFLISTSSK